MGQGVEDSLAGEVTRGWNRHDPDIGVSLVPLKAAD